MMWIDGTIKPPKPFRSPLTLEWISVFQVAGGIANPPREENGSRHSLS